MEETISCHGLMLVSAYTQSDRPICWQGRNAFIRKRSQSGGGLPSDMTAESSLWKKLWKSKAPGKMKITVWRFAHDSLPSGHQLLRRRVPAAGACFFCGREETVEHTLLFCHYTQEVWSRVKARTRLKLQRSLFTTTKAWVFDFLDRANDHAVIILAVMVWHIWNARNGVRHDEPIKHPHSLAEQILAYIDMIQLHLLKHCINHSREATTPTPSWSPPPEGTIVINMDAAMFSASSRTGVGVVVRNHKGEFLAAHSQLLDETMTPEIAEAHAIRCVVSLARDEGWNRIVLASDCLAVIQRIKAPERDRSLPLHRFNRKLEAAAGTRSSPEQEATPGRAAATREILVLDNDAAHPSDARRSSDAPSDPLPPSPVSSPLVVDDASRPLILLLIARLGIAFPRLTVGLHWEAKLMGRGALTRMEPVNTNFYQLGNGGSLIFEHDLNALSDHLDRPHPEFHGAQISDQPGGELQWIITADLRGKMEPPTSERILFSFMESNWLDGLARALQEGLARLCGMSGEALRHPRFSHLARRNSAGEPMDMQPHPELKHHVDHLDFMLYHTQQDLDNARSYANQTHLALAEHADAIKLLAKDRKTLRRQKAKKDATIARLRAKIASLEATVKAQEDQLNEMEEDGEDIQGGSDFLSDDNDFEDDENTEGEDYDFLDDGEDDHTPLDVDDDEEE
ncbi:hypothetical protein QYE76_024064 [Lolium multiflorum]|uniref:Reverse transcriptase zinc-binding domain-containing protein n=1 Tax=Lolium multiflorum TaxID=4521 RepID=A0AAD8RCM8_LOLMU|nr:hypothetical protein QYE76_024064 [Lolium multiflorum]